MVWHLLVTAVTLFLFGSHAAMWRPPLALIYCRYHHTQKLLLCTNKPEVRSLTTLNISSFQKGPPKLTGSLKINNRLQKARKLFENEIIGPESFAVDSTGVVYTGSADGKIWRISGQDAEVLTTTGTNASECGKTSPLLFSNSQNGKSWLILYPS